MAFSTQEKVAVSISLAASRLARVGFGIPLLYHQYYDEASELPYRVKEYSTITGLTDDGFPSVQTVQFSVDTVATSDVVINGNTYSASTVGATIDDYAIELAALINAGETTVLATATGSASGELVVISTSPLVTFTYAASTNTTLDYAQTNDLYLAAAALLGQNVGPATFKVGLIGSDEAFSSGFADVLTADSDFYRTILLSTTASDISAMAAVIQPLEPRKRLFAVDDDTDMYDDGEETNIAYILKAGGYSRTNISYSTATQKWANASYVGRFGSPDIGTIFWAMKPIKSMEAESLTTAQKSVLRDRYVAFLEDDGADIIHTSQGVYSDGNNIDLLDGLDLLESRISEDLFGWLKAKDKPVFSQADLNEVSSLIYGSLTKWGVGQNILLPDLKDSPIRVNVPAFSAISSADKAAGLLDKVTFSAVAASPIKDIVVTGAVTQ